MNFKILKKDLRRKKSMNLILLVFIFLATTLIAASINNLAVIMNGVDYFFEQAGIADFIIVMMGGSPDNPSENEQNAEAFLAEQENVTDYTIDELLYLSKNQIEIDGVDDFILNDSVILSSWNIGQQKFFDIDSKLITEMEDGTIYLSHGTVADNQLKPGDVVHLKMENGYEKEFRLLGYFKDAFLGSDMMGTQRYLISDHDFEEMLEKSGLPYGKLYSVHCDDIQAFESDYNRASLNVLFGDGKEMLKMVYVMNMVVAAVLLLVSLCLVIISIIMLRFTIIFTINEDYKEIGIMKAIGIGDRSIRELYLSKYLVIASAGAIPGFAASIPFSRILLMQVMENMVLEDSGIWLQLLSSIVIVFSVVFFAWLSTGRIHKFTPMDAIRSGNSGERFKKKGAFRLADSRFAATTFLAWNDVLSELRKYLVLIATSVVGVWLIVMPVNTINTLCSDRIGDWFALTECDFFISDDERISKLVLSGDRQQYYDYLEEIGTKLDDTGVRTSSVIMEALFRLKIRNGEESYNSLSVQGLGTETDQYFYDEGVPPVYENEIAVTHVVAEKIHADIGDTVYISGYGTEKPYIITALYQSMNNLGEGIRFAESADVDYSSAGGGFGVQVTLKERPDKTELAEVVDEVQRLMPAAVVKTSTRFMADMIGGSIMEQLNFLKIFVLTIVVAINVLVVVLMQKMFLIRERGEMGMLKAVGFTDGAIISWQTKRIMLVLFCGIVLGTLTGTPFSRITAGEIFKIMGATSIVFEIRVLEVYVIYPIVLFAMIVLACVITMGKVRTIQAQEINNIE